MVLKTPEPGGGKAVKRTVILFPRAERAPIETFKGRQRFGTVQLPNYGAVRFAREAVIPLYRGRVFWPSKHYRRQQKRSIVLCALEGNGAPLIMGAGHQNYYHGYEISRQDVLDTRNIAAHHAAADHERQGSYMDQYTRQLILALIVAIVLTGGIFLSIFLLKLLRG